VNNVFKKAADDPSYKGALAVTDKELVSADFRGNPAGSIVDLNLTQVIDNDLVKVVSWYDNEMGYSIRLAEFVKYIQG
jgi:glyceraldehyde 3-phosphate dehydrogenase